MTATMKRFYTLVSTQETPSGFRILLDGKPVKTAGKRELLAPCAEIANAVMHEWSAQEIKITPDTMPLTQILNTKIDRVSEDRDAITDYLIKYLDTDLLCYHTPTPEALAAQQAELWQPWLDWFAAHYGAPLQTTTGLNALRQSDDIHITIAAQIAALGDDEFTLLQLVTSLSGSLVLGLAFLFGGATPQEIINAAYVEEHFKDSLYNAEKYGRDPMQEKKEAANLRDLDACTLYLRALRQHA